MLRISLVLFMLCASAHAMAQNGREAAAMAGECPEAEGAVGEETGQQTIAPPAASAARIKSAKPAAPAPASTRGGGDDSLPRSRSYKWQSFLPGMFR
ncbi:MAG: hypothetical protein LH491_03975 [Pseudoxanthomonas sp.]|nr:hypothetical protein [Pseudoxanthomonas sp.]